jgi:hypothetical protein
MPSIINVQKPGSDEVLYRAFIRRTGQPAISKTFKTKKEALAWAREIEYEQDKGIKHDLKGARETTVESLFVRFRDEVCPTRKGSKWEIVRINRLLRTAIFMRRRLDQINPQDIRSWRDNRLKEVSAASVARELKLVSSVFSKAKKLWDAPIGTNPCFLVEKPANSDVSRNRRPSQSELDAIVKASGIKEGVPAKSALQLMGWCVLLAVETAMRIGEIVSIRVCDFHEQERYVQLTDTKNGENRAVPLSNRAVEILKQLCIGKEDEDLLIKVSSAVIGLRFREVCQSLGIDDLHFHDTRHEATTRLSKKLTNVLELSAVTGHKTLSNLKRYYNPTPGELAAKLD